MNNYQNVSTHIANADRIYKGDSSNIDVSTELSLQFQAMVPQDDPWWKSNEQAKKNWAQKIIRNSFARDYITQEIQAIFNRTCNSTAEIRKILEELIQDHDDAKLGLFILQCKKLSLEQRSQIFNSGSTSLLHLAARASINKFNWIVQLCPPNELMGKLNEITQDWRETPIDALIRKNTLRELAIGLIHNEDIKFALAKELASRNPSLSSDLPLFGIKNNLRLEELGLLAAQNYPYEVVRNVHAYSMRYGFIEEIIQIAVETNYFDFVLNLETLNINDPDMLFNIAKIIAEKGDAAVLTKNLHKFQLGNETWKYVKLAEIVAQASPSNFSTSWKDFTLFDQEQRTRLARICLRNLPVYDVQYFKTSNFIIDRTSPQGKKCLREIYSTMFKLNPQGAAHRYTAESESQIQDPTTYPKLSKLSYAIMYNDTDAFQFLEKEAKEIPVLKDALVMIKGISDEKIKGKMLDALCYFYYEIHSSENPTLVATNLDKLKNPLLRILDLKDPALRMEMMESLVRAVSRSDFTPVPSLNSRTQQLYIQLVSMGLEELFPTNLGGYLDDQVRERALLSTLIDIQAADFKTPKKAATEPIQQEESDTRSVSLAFLFDFSDDDKIFSETPDYKKTIVQYLFTTIKDTKTSIVMQLRALLGISGKELIEDAYREKQPLNVEQLLKKAFEQQLPQLTAEENFSAKFESTFLSSRNPFAVMRYLGSLLRLGGKLKTTVLSDLSKCIQAIINNRFTALRENITNNPHLQKLQAKFPDLLAKFHQGGSKVVKGAEMQSGSEAAHVTIRRNLTNAIMNDNHFKNEDIRMKPEEVAEIELPALRLEMPPENAIAALEQEIAGCENKSKLTCLKLHKNILLLCRENLSAADAKSIISEIKAALLPSCQLRGDLDVVQSTLRRTSSNESFYTISDSNDPYDLMYCGLEVEGSCQRLDGDPKLNRGVLGYMLNGQDRILTLKPGAGGPQIPIKGRAITRLLLDEDGKPVLQIERIYPQNLDAKYKTEMLKFAKERANALGVPLVSLEEGPCKTKYGKKVHNYGGPASEYVDAAKGIQPNSIYTIDNLYLVD